MNKLLIIHQISPLNLVLIILFRVIGYRVNYFDVTKILKKKIFIFFLNELGVRRIDYNEVPINNGLAFNHLIKCNYKISSLISKSLWSNQLKEIFLNINNLNLCIADESINNLKKTNEIISYKNFIYKKKEIKKLLLIVEFNLQNYTYFKNYLKTNNLKVLYLLNLSKFFLFLINIFKAFTKYISITLNLNDNFKKKKNRSDKKFFESKILFFPHHGAFNLRVDKRYYYSKNHNYLNPSNILHVELLNSDRKFLEPSLLKFYYKNKIKNIVWEDLEKKISLDLIMKAIYLSLKNLRKLNFLNYFLLFKIIYKLNYHLKTLSKFKKIRVILVGQLDFFPNILSVASRLKKIKTISFQNKLVGPPMLVKMKCVDRYFCVGKNSIKNLLFKYDKQMRLDKIFSVLKSNEKKFKQNSKIKNCLILPYSINPHWFNEGRQIVSNNNNVAEFLNKSILIIKKERKINFIIKFKSNSFKFDEKINDLVRKLKKFKNAKIKYDFILKQREVNNFDLVIGQPSSLIETCIASDIPCLIYEKNESYKNYINCNDNKIFCNYENIINKFYLHKKNFFYYKKNISNVKNKLFFNYSQKKIEEIKKQINEICK